jgi:BCD family chlorophyll transporter-like MFS transporter
MAHDATAFGTVFLIEAALFVTAAFMALRVMDRPALSHASLVPGE